MSTSEDEVMCLLVGEKEPDQHTTEANLVFIRRIQLYKIEKPFLITFPVDKAKGEWRSNIQYSTHLVSIHDIRGSEIPFALDLTGFEMVRHVCQQPYEIFADDEQIRKYYYREIEQLLRDKLKASRVVIFDHTVSIFLRHYYRTT
jgi:hypothetical protein